TGKKLIAPSASGSLSTRTLPETAARFKPPAPEQPRPQRVSTARPQPAPLRRTRVQARMDGSLKRGYDLAPRDGAQRLPGGVIDVLLDEAHGAVAEQDIDAAGMPAARRRGVIAARTRVAGDARQAELRQVNAPGR